MTATKQLVDLVGPSQAKYILLSGRHIDVNHASRIGLVDQVFTPEVITEETYKFAESICKKAQFTVRSMKEIIGLINSGQTEDDDYTEHLRTSSFDTEDYKEGVQAFLEKRKPNFQYS